MTFRTFGPIHRFDHHQATPSDIPAYDNARRICYVAPTLSCCVVEVFGERIEIETAEWRVAHLTLRRDLFLLDLRGAGAMRAGTVAAVSKHTERTETQAWSRYFYEDTAFYDAEGKPIEGVLYYGAHNDEEAIALYERAEDALDCLPGSVLRLDDPTLYPALVQIALEHNMIF